MSRNFRRNSTNQKSLLRSGKVIHKDYGKKIQQIPGSIKPQITIPTKEESEYAKRSYGLQKRHTVGKLDQHFDITGKFQLVTQAGADRLAVGAEQTIWSYRIPSGQAFMIQTYQFFAIAQSQPLLSQQLYGPTDLWGIIRFYIKVNGAGPVHTRTVYSYIDGLGVLHTDEQEGFQILTQEIDKVPRMSGPSIEAPASSLLEVTVRNISYVNATTSTPIRDVGFRLRGFASPIRIEE